MKPGEAKTYGRLSRKGGPAHDVGGWKQCTKPFAVLFRGNPEPATNPCEIEVLGPDRDGSANRHLVLCKPERLCYTLPARERLFRMFLGSSAVEHSTVNRMVAGSNPARGASNSIPKLAVVWSHRSSRCDVTDRCDLTSKSPNRARWARMSAHRRWRDGALAMEVALWILAAVAVFYIAIRVGFAWLMHRPHA